MQRLRLLTLVSAYASLSTTLLYAQLGPNLIVNGSFETPESYNRWGGEDTYFAGQSFLGWRITQESIDIVRVPTRFTTLPSFAYDGQQYVDLNGSPGVGGIAQDFTISQDGVYRLQFAMSANLDTTVLGPRTMRVDITSGSTTVYTDNFTWNFNNPDQWVPYSIDIVLPAAGNYTLTFTSTTFLEDPVWGRAFGPIIDDVRLQLVPEPASLLALGAGVAGLVGLRRRKR